MLKFKEKFIAIVTITILLNLIFSTHSAADEAGVGVLNVPPKFGIIQLVQQEENIRVYLTISDYNSWEDLFIVNITLINSDSQSTSFIFKQYKDSTSYEKIYEFSEEPDDSNLLIEEKCSYTHSNKKETVDDKCNLDLIFVFHSTFFSKINIIATDLEGSTATTKIDYTSEEIMRGGNIIIVPGPDEPIVILMPSYILNIIAIILAIIGTIYLIKKIEKKKRIAYGKKN
jgi:hypothetical protein